MPISISPKFVDTWYIFTDDACEGDSKDLKVGGIDAVLVTPYGKYLPCFGRQLPGKWMKKNYMNTLPFFALLETVSPLKTIYISLKLIKYPRLFKLGK